MSLWIRSQDKTRLVCARGFECVQNSTRYCQIYSIDNNNYELIGTYTNIELGKEILNRIQEFIGTNGEVNSPVTMCGFKNVNVYEMPKDEEEGKE